MSKPRLAKIKDIVITPHANPGTVLRLSVDGKEATVAVDGRSYNVTLPREVLRVAVKNGR